MPARALRQLSGRSQLRLRLHPGSVEELDKCEWQQDQEKDHSGEQDNDRKDAPEVTRKGNVPKAERGHHRQCPIQAGNPAMLTTFEKHYDVKQDAENSNEKSENQQEAKQKANVATAGRRLQEISELRGQELHTRGLLFFGRYLNISGITAFPYQSSGEQTRKYKLIRS